MAPSDFDLTPVQWQQLRALLRRALDQPPQARHAWVDALGAADAPWRPRLHALLAHADCAPGAPALDTLPKVETDQFAPRPDGPVVPVAPAAQAGECVGPYRLLQPIGEGGMASVWLAERTDVLQRRRVALKLPHGAWSGRFGTRCAGLAERLAREREILATLAHPHIARLYDAGVADDGQPYLALEHVQGEPIDRWCAAHDAPLRRRIELFLQVCDAVAHAHAQLVVHRDLKPANILVDGAGRAMLLDFGVARMLDDGIAGDGALTRETGRALTPDYAAPEQIEGAAAGTAADIYALGVVLFELLALRRPYALARTGGAGLLQAVAAVRVPRPSDVVADPARRRALRGDLDTILLKALKKSPAERYATVDALAADLRRHLAHEPVLARPDGMGYRLRKWVVRHRLAAAAGAAMTVSLVAGAGVSLWQARVAIAERDRAEQVRSFVESVLRGSDPFRGQEPARTVTELLQHAQRRVDTELGASPDLAVEMLLLVGNSLRNRQDDAAAAQALDEAVARARRTLGDDHDLTHRARVARLYLQRLNGPREGLAAEVDALVRHMAAGGAAARVRIDALRLQAVVAIEEGRVADALAPAREALQAGLRDLGDADTSTAAAASVLALAHETAREPQAALAQAEQAIAILHRVHGSTTNHPDLLFARGVRARALGAVGRLGEAAAAMHGVVHDAAVHFGAQAREVGFHWRDLSNLQRAAGQVREATRAAEQAVRIFGAWSSGQNVHLTGAHFALGASLLAERRLDDAIEVLEPLHADLAAGGAPAETAQARRVAQLLAPALAQRGRIEQARALLHGAGASAPPDDAAQRRATAEVERWSGDAGRALVHARAAVAAAQASGDAARLRAWPLLAHALLADGQAREALTAFDEALAAMDRAGVADSPDRADVHLGRGLALNALRRPDEARADFRRSAEFWEAFAPAAGEAGRARVWLHSSTETDGYASPPSPR